MHWLADVSVLNCSHGGGVHVHNVLPGTSVRQQQQPGSGGRSSSHAAAMSHGAAAMSHGVAAMSHWVVAMSHGVASGLRG